MELSLDKLKGALDEVRAQVAPRNDTERRVYEALSSKNWGASTTLMNQIAQDTYDYERYGMIMRLVWQHMDSPGRSWRQTFKSLTLLDHLIKNGAERIIEESRDHMHKIRTLTDFNHYEGNVDRGAGVREKAKALLELLSSNDAIRSEREKARKLRDKFVGIGSGASGYGGYGGHSHGGSSGPSYSGRYDGFGSEAPPRTDDYHHGSSYRAGGDTSRPARYSDAASGGGDRARGYSDHDDTGRYGGSSSHQAGHSSYADRDRERERDDHPREESVASDEPEPVKPKAKPKAKVKKAESPAVVAAPSKPQPAADLIGDSFFADPPAAAPVATPAFDAFGLNTAPAAGAATFDAFGQSTFAPSSNTAGFASDPFATPAFPQPAPVVPVAQNPQFGMFSGSHTVQPTPQVPAYPPAGAFAQPQYQPMPQTNVPGGFGNVVMNAQAAAHGAMGSSMQHAVLSGAPAMARPTGTPMSAKAQPQSFMPAAPQAPTPVAHADNDFGDFQGQPAETPTSAAPKNSKWASIGGLVDLNGLSSDKETKQAQAAAEAPQRFDDHQSFHGLDGFTRGTPTGPAGRPMGGPSATATMGMGMPRPMQPTGMGMGMSMGQPMGTPMMQPGMGMQPSMGMGMQPTMSMGGMQPAMGMGMGMGGGMQQGMGMQPMMGMQQGMGMQPTMGMGGMGMPQQMGMGMGGQQQMMQPSMGPTGYGVPAMGSQGMGGYPNYGMGGARGF